MICKSIVFLYSIRTYFENTENLPGTRYLLLISFSNLRRKNTATTQKMRERKTLYVPEGVYNNKNSGNAVIYINLKVTLNEIQCCEIVTRSFLEK